MKTLYCVVDTTGKFLFREPTTHPDQPHLVRLAWVIADDNGETVAAWGSLIQPRTGWIYEPDATVAHGVTVEAAVANGMPLERVMGRFIGALEDVDRFVGFNVDFVTKVLQRSAAESGQDAVHLLEGKSVECAMRRATDIVRVPRMAPGGGWNWPKLSVAYEFFSIGDELPSLDMDPVERGILLAHCVRIIDQGIIEHLKTVSRDA